MDAGDALAGLEADVGAGLQALRRVAGVGQPEGEGHREAARMRGSDELLRAGARLSRLGPLTPGERELGEGSAGGTHGAPSADQVPVPGRACAAFDGHVDPPGAWLVGIWRRPPALLARVTPEAQCWRVPRARARACNVAPSVRPAEREVRRGRSC